MSNSGRALLEHLEDIFQPDRARLTSSTELYPGQQLRLDPHPSAVASLNKLPFLLPLNTASFSPFILSISLF